MNNIQMKKIYKFLKSLLLDLKYLNFITYLNY